MIVPGTVLLFVTAVSGMLLGKEQWPQANAFLLFAGGLAAVITIAGLGNVVIDRLVPPRRMFPVADPQSDATRQFFGDAAGGGG